MTGSEIKFSVDLKGFEKWAKMLMPQSYDRHFRAHIPRATGQNALFFAAGLRKTIQSSKGLTPNAPLTQAIKGADKPLVDYGDLFKNITHQKIDELSYFVGLKRTEKDFDVAKFVTEGGAIPVTDRMRSMFFFLWKASEGNFDPGKLTGRAQELWSRKSGGWLPLAESTTVIVIPERNFVAITMADPSLKKKLEQNWQRAMGFVFRDMRRQWFPGGSGK
jgi:hypothetical protein